MADKYSTIQQHQPLRVPAQWGKQERTLIVQLEEIFDDVYKRFGRLRMEDMGKDFQKRIEDDEGNIASILIDVEGIDARFETVEGDIAALDIRAGEIELEVSNKYDEVSGISITTAGIDISGSKYVRIESGCSIEIISGGSFTVASGQFGIDANGNATFAGTMSAACITSGTMSANRISGGTIDATDVTITNLDASKITSGTLSADYISGGTINASNVTITNLDASNIVTGTIDAANVIITHLDASQISAGKLNAGYIEGGTLTLGGQGNDKGTLRILNASGTEIGRWDKDGIWAKTGTFYGSLDSVTGTFDNLKAGNWQFDNNGAHLNVGNYNMGIGDATGSRYTDGGVYFNVLNGTPPSGGSAVQSQVELLAKSSDSAFNTAVLLECLKYSDGTYTGAFYQVAATGPAGVSLGKAGQPWYKSYLDNVYGTSHLYFYPAYSVSNQFIQMYSDGYNGGLIVFDAYGASTRKLGQASQPWTEAYITNLYYDTMTQTSSRNVKHNIRDMESMGGTLDKLRPVTFAYNKDPDEKKRHGLIYEETIDVLPEVCVDEGINYMELVPMLLKEVQDLRKRVQALEERCR